MIINFMKKQKRLEKKNSEPTITPLRNHQEMRTSIGNAGVLKNDSSIGKVRISDQFLQTSSVVSTPIESIKSRNFANFVKENNTIQLPRELPKIPATSNHEDDLRTPDLQSTTNEEPSFNTSQTDSDAFNQSYDPANNYSIQDFNKINNGVSNDEWEEAEAAKFTEFNNQVNLGGPSQILHSSDDQSLEYNREQSQTSETKVRGFAALALYDFETEDEDKICFKANDLIIDVEQVI
jgi:hypothetical protein